MTRIAKDKLEVIAFWSAKVNRRATVVTTTGIGKTIREPFSADPTHASAIHGA
jgi:hypothetical protein